MTTGEARPQTDSIVPLHRNRDFQILWSAQAVSMLGTAVSQIAYPLLILALTGSATYAGLMATVEMVVLLLAMLPAGVLADRLDRRVIMIACNIGRAAVLGVIIALVLADRATVWMIIVAGGVSAIGDGLFSPSSRGAVKQLVPPAQMSSAFAAQEGRNAVASMLGPPLSGLLFSVGRALPFVFDAVTYVAGSIALLFVRKPFQGERGAEHAEPLWKGATAGYVFVWRSPMLRALLSWSVVVNLAFAGVPVVLIAHATKYGASSSLTGLMITFIGLGMLGGALASPWLVKVVPPSTLVFCTAFFLPVGLVAMAVTPWPILLGVIGGLVTSTIPPLNSMLGAYMGTMVPDRLQGRVGAASMLAAMGLKPLGPLALGVVFDNFGTLWSFVAAAAVALLAALFTLDRDVRHMRRPEELAVE